MKFMQSLRLLLLVSSLVAANASNILNPVAVGLRSALTSRSNVFGSSARSRRTNNAPTIGFDWLDTCSDFGDEVEEVVSPINSRRGGIHNNPMTNVSNTKVPVPVPVQVKKSKPSRGGGVAAPALTFYENMICGAVSRSIAQVCTHPANT